MPAPATVFLTFIPFECPSCRRQLRVVADRAGRLVRCPVCRGMASVPGEAVETATPPDDPTLPLGPLAETERG